MAQGSGVQEVVRSSDLGGVVLGIIVYRHWFFVGLSTMSFYGEEIVPSCRLFGNVCYRFK